MCTAGLTVLQDIFHREGAHRKRFFCLISPFVYRLLKRFYSTAVAHALQTKIYCDARKAAILRCQADPELDALLTSNPLEASVHLVPLGIITSDKLKTYVERFKGVFGKAVGLRPTGWTFVVFLCFRA